MIGLIFFASVAIWFHIALLLGLALPHWFGLKGPLRWLLSLLLIPALFVLPVADDWIGMHQFNALCKREAVVTLSPNWRNVERAKEMVVGPIRLNGYIISIDEWRMEYIDADTGDNLLTLRAFMAEGGILYRLGLGLGASRSCSPPNESEVTKEINLQQLVERGKINE